MAKAESGLQSMEEIERVTCCDFHLNERQEDILPYIEAPFDEMLGRSGEDYGYLGSLYTSGGKLHPITIGKVQPDTVRSREAVRNGMEKVDVDRAVISPTLNNSLGGIQHDDLAAALASAYNEWLLDEIVAPEEDIYGAALVAPHRPRRAAEEVDRLAGEDGIASVHLPTAGVNIPLGDERYYPLYEACEDAGLPIQMHNANDVSSMLSFPHTWWGLKRHMPTHAFVHPAQHMVNLLSLITQGVPIRYPGVDFVFLEGGLGWVPFLMRRFDNEYSIKREDAPMLEKPPSEYIKEHCYFGSQPVEGNSDPEYVSQIVRLMDGPNTLMLATDYPHSDFDHTDQLFGLLDGFEDGELESIFQTNADGVYKF